MGVYSVDLILGKIDMPAPRRNAMNLFILHANPREAAQAHADKHVIKMINCTCNYKYVEIMHKYVEIMHKYVEIMHK